MFDAVMTAQWWAHALGFGLLATLICGGVLLAVLFLAPYAFFNDYPQDIRDAARQPTPAQQRAAVLGGAVFVVAVVVGFGAVTWTWGAAHNDTGFVELALMTLVGITLFAAFDILIIDWLIICTWRPRRLVYPGTADCAGWGDYAFHVTEQLRPRGLVALVGISSVIGLVVWLLT